MEAGYFFSCLVQDRASFVLIEVMTIDWNGLSGFGFQKMKYFLLSRFTEIRSISDSSAVA